MSRNTVLSAVAMLAIMVATPQLYPSIGAIDTAVAAANSGDITKEEAEKQLAGMY